MRKLPTCSDPAGMRPRRQNSSKYHNILLAICFLGLFSGIFLWFQRPEEKNAEAVPKTIVLGEENSAEQKEDPKKNIFTYTISEGDIPAEVFARYAKFSANEIQALLSAAADVYDFTKIKIGQNMQFITDDREKIEKIRYYPNSESVIVAEADGGKFQVRKENIPYETKEETLHIRIDEYLYKDALDTGLSEASILEIADVFSFDIDFATDIRQGDEVKLVYEKRTLDGQPAPDGNVIAAKFTNAGQEYFAYYFEDGHYDSEGKELVRQFLRAPLSYRKITSGYTGARFHPITKTVTAHYQIDYAAPTGTPVVATARGTVASAGFEGGWGHIVRLRHDNGYTTHYAHLSGYAKGIRSGSSVSQGQVIGYVGSTGWSTGPHLDYGMKLNGSPINPMSLKLPKGTPLAGEQMEKFQEMRRKYDGVL